MTQDWIGVNEKSAVRNLAYDMNGRRQSSVLTEVARDGRARKRATLNLTKMGGDRAPPLQGPDVEALFLRRTEGR